MPDRGRGATVSSDLDTSLSRVPESRRRLIEAVRDDNARAPVGATYSRFVGLMKLVLPLGAIALTSLVFVWPYMSGHDDGFELDFADVGTDESNATFMTNARYFATDEESQPYTITAESVHELNGVSDQFKLTAPKADVLLNSGDWLALTAIGGILDRKKETLVLSDGVSVFSDSGYEFRTQQAQINLRTTDARGDSAVVGQGPLGVLNAAGFEVRDKGKSVLFLGPVELVLYPKAES